MENNVYLDLGFANRKEYLISLANEYDAPLNEVLQLADFFGETEDFDGLVLAVRDLEDFDS